MKVLKAIGAFLLAHWKVIITVALALAGIYLGKRIVGAVIDSILGKVNGAGGQPFKPLDDTHVAVQVGGAWQNVLLPRDAAGSQVKSGDVTAIVIVPGHPAMVEAKTNASNRV